MSTPEANAGQVPYWNEAAGPKWVAFQKIIDAQIAPLGERAMDRAGIAPGERVIDVGCGCGDTTIALARRVGPTGLVLGVDISAPMLERAAETARAAVAAHGRLQNARAPASTRSSSTSCARRSRSAEAAPSSRPSAS